MEAHTDLVATAERIMAGGFCGVEFSRLIPRGKSQSLGKACLIFLLGFLILNFFSLILKGKFPTPEGNPVRFSRWDTFNPTITIVLG